jgi:hypothetical protein
MVNQIERSLQSVESISSATSGTWVTAFIGNSWSRSGGTCVIVAISDNISLPTACSVVEMTETVPDRIFLVPEDADIYDHQAPNIKILGSRAERAGCSDGIPDAN